jgi:hypothetical protein
MPLTLCWATFGIPVVPPVWKYAATRSRWLSAKVSLSAGIRASSVVKSLMFAVCCEGFFGRIHGTMTFFRPDR